MNPVHNLAEAPPESSPSLVATSSPTPGPAPVLAVSAPASVILPPISPSSPPPLIATPVQSLAILASAHHQQQEQQQQQSPAPGPLPRPDEPPAVIASAATAAASTPPSHFFQPQPPPPQHHQHPSSALSSPPPRKDTASSISTQATSATQASTETTNTSYSSDTSPTLHQSIFSLKDGTDVSNSRRTSRRRTGPLSQQSRERAALIRKLGACSDCRRRRVACKPSHHNMTWEDVVNKFHRSHSPSIHDIAPLAPGRPLSPAPAQASGQHMFSHNPHEMDIDSGSPSNHPSRPPPPGDSRHRTPLPSGPRLESLSLPGIETLKNELQSSAVRMLSTASRSRYTAVQALLLFWQDDDDDVATIHNAVRELADVLENLYHYALQIQAIPSSADGSRSSWRWLSRQMGDFAEDRDQRDVLKIVYYVGHTYLDGNREMVLASSRDSQKASIIRWNGIQQILEEAYADTLLLMDAAYYPSSRMCREKGVLELIAASTSDEHYVALNRCAFTLALAELLRTRASRVHPCSAAELHSALLSSYPMMVRDRNPEREVLTSFPAPLHTMMSGNSRLPSIFVAPVSQSNPLRNSLLDNYPILNMSIRLMNDEEVDLDSWNEWLRLMPEGVRDVKVEGPFRPAFR
ncbi:unnamed protein product [Clonostachys rosea]|uniref:Zn(2)-C6 fungal-type domain-containing protein n=1 Tax=Bionectria ochroleuca TaxID=29856 RepID=A0ABY6UFR8_BIOOC|nr:unnamed protein product [Clonostachys rosea]